jgi:hypothetical protein
MQSNYADLRGQFIVMSILAVAIGLRSLYASGGDPISSVPTFPTSQPAQQDRSDHANGRSSQLSIPEPQCCLERDNLQLDTHSTREFQE